MEAFMIGVVAFVKMYPGTVKASLLLLAASWRWPARLAAHGALACRGGGPRAGRRGDRRRAFTCRDGRSSRDGPGRRRRPRGLRRVSPSSSPTPAFAGCGPSDWGR